MNCGCEHLYTLENLLQTAEFSKASFERLALEAQKNATLRGRLAAEAFNAAKAERETNLVSHPLFGDNGKDPTYHSLGEILVQFGFSKDDLPIEMCDRNENPKKVSEKLKKKVFVR